MGGDGGSTSRGSCQLEQPAFCFTCFGGRNQRRERRVVERRYNTLRRFACCRRYRFVLLNTKKKERKKAVPFVAREPGQQSFDRIETALKRDWLHNPGQSRVLQLRRQC